MTFDIGLWMLNFGTFFDTSPLHQFSKFNNFLWVCWFLGKIFPVLYSPLGNPYCHNAGVKKTIFYYWKIPLHGISSFKSRRHRLLILWCLLIRACNSTILFNTSYEYEQPQYSSSKRTGESTERLPQYDATITVWYRARLPAAPTLQPAAAAPRAAPRAGHAAPSRVRSFRPQAQL